MKGEGEEKDGGREGGREMCYPQGLLLIASLMSLRDVFFTDWIWIQLCHLGGASISAQQTTAQFDVPCFFFLFLSFAACFLERTPPSEVARL